MTVTLEKLVEKFRQIILNEEFKSCISDDITTSLDEHKVENLQKKKQQVMLIIMR